MDDWSFAAEMRSIEEDNEDAGNKESECIKTADPYELPEGWQWEDKFRIVKYVNPRTGRTDIEIRFGKLGFTVESEYQVVLIPPSVILAVLTANNSLPNSVTVKEAS